MMATTAKMYVLCCLQFQCSMASMVCARWLPLFWCTFIALVSTASADFVFVMSGDGLGSRFFSLPFFAITLLLFGSYAQSQHMHKCDLAAFLLMSQLEHFILLLIFYSVYLFPVFKHFLRFYFCHVDYYLMQLQLNRFLPIAHTKMHFTTISRSLTRSIVEIVFSEMKKKRTNKLTFNFGFRVHKRKREINWRRKNKVLSLRCSFLVSF